MTTVDPPSLLNKSVLCEFRHSKHRSDSPKRKPCRASFGARLWEAPRLRNGWLSFHTTASWSTFFQHLFNYFFFFYLRSSSFSASFSSFSFFSAISVMFGIKGFKPNLAPVSKLPSKIFLTIRFESALARFHSQGFRFLDYNVGSDLWVHCFFLLFL